MEKISLTAGPFEDSKAICFDGTLYDIGIVVNRWHHKDGFNGYTREINFVDKEDRKTGKIVRKKIAGNRYSARAFSKKNAKDKIKQFFIHHSGGDGKDPSVMYNTLWFDRGLSVQYAIEDDGRIYQFVDAIECCWHAGRHNKISIGVECCLYPLASENPNYYSEERRKWTGNLPHEIVEDEIHGRVMKVFCMTEPQIDALARLAAGTWISLLHQTDHACFEESPKFPRQKQENKIPRTVIYEPQKHTGMIGHLQCTKNKIDPAGFPWERFEKMTHKYWEDFMSAFLHRKKEK